MNWSWLHSPTIRQLRAFCTVSRLLNFTQDAKELGSQQPAVSEVVSIIVIVPWTDVWPQGGELWALLFDAVVLVAFLSAWGMRFAEEGKPL
jgi:hypothetical protein